MPKSFPLADWKEFPTSGRLLFFCDPTSSGALKEEQPSASVMFLIDKTDRLRRREFPLEFDNPTYGRPTYGRQGNFMFRPRRVT